MKKYLYVIFAFFAINYYSNAQIVKFTVIGDIMAHDNLQEFALATPEGYSVLFNTTKDIFLSDDITFANLEVPIRDEKDISGYPLFNAKSGLVKAVKEAGIDMLSLANNHSIDQSYAGISSTIDAVEKEGLIYAGTGKTPNEAKKAKIFLKNGITFGFISATFYLNGIYMKEIEDAPYAYLVEIDNTDDIDEFCERIRQTKAATDFTIVSYHFGIEYSKKPLDSHVKVVEKLANSGGDLILGHHPHVLHETKYFKTTDGRNSLIFYSLGNFISAQARYLDNPDADPEKLYDSVLTRTAEALVAQFDVVKLDGRTSIVNASAIPFFNMRYVYKSGDKTYDGFELRRMNEIIAGDDLSGDKFRENAGLFKDIVLYRLNEIFKNILKF